MPTENEKPSIEDQNRTLEQLLDRLKEIRDEENAIFRVPVLRDHDETDMVGYIKDHEIRFFEPVTVRHGESLTLDLSYSVAEEEYESQGVRNLKKVKLHYVSISRNRTDHEPKA